MQPIVEQFGDVTVVTVQDEYLDSSNADHFRRDITPVLEESHRVVLALGRVQFVDSRACGIILSCLKSVAAANGDLKLCEVTKPVRAVFELIRLHRICQILDTKEDAVQAFQT
ncbi:MAG: STAS domain-containing protein [Gemmataceae bacterium]|nr:STAS domain-containing protein [Gemmataceae bacterium]